MELMLDVGIILLFVGTIWLIALAFMDSIAFGIITLWLLPLIYAQVKNDWKNSRTPFAIHLVGLTLVVSNKIITA